MHLHTSAGRYICGEETALLNALEGKRANPARQAALPASLRPMGQADDRQECRDALQRPAYRESWRRLVQELSRSEDGGTKLYGVSGKVKRPGLWELPMGTTIREILEEHAGGMRDGYQFRGSAARRRLHRLSHRGASRCSHGFRFDAESRQPHGHRHDDRPR